MVRLTMSNTQKKYIFLPTYTLGGKKECCIINANRMIIKYMEINGTIHIKNVKSPHTSCCVCVCCMSSPFYNQIDVSEHLWAVLYKKKWINCMLNTIERTDVICKERGKKKVSYYVWKYKKISWHRWLICAYMKETSRVGREEELGRIP